MRGTSTVLIPIHIYRATGTPSGGVKAGGSSPSACRADKEVQSTENQKLYALYHPTAKQLPSMVYLLCPLATAHFIGEEMRPEE